ncbi:cytochrome c oxidase subunit 1 [Cichlidogyrus casuarinus]|uniref:Cytochrome c oxidase subunit 1 n=1 Tax=Cichlidogyrus casuarinus TaxID=1844966 RepID=A0ABD2PWB3_9PLAT
MIDLNCFSRAVKYYSRALQVDPSYTRAYVCRAEAHFAAGQYSDAVADFSQCIFHNPCTANYYMMLGNALTRLNKPEVVKLCVKRAAELNKRNQETVSLRQQATVLSFLNKDEEAVNVLAKHCRFSVNKQLLILFAKTQMKAGKWNDASKTLERILELMKPTNAFSPWPPASIEISYLLGVCGMAVSSHLQAISAFTQAIKTDPDCAKAYLKRAECFLRLALAKNNDQALSRESDLAGKGLEDISRVFVICQRNPQEKSDELGLIEEAYLMRAALFGANNRKSKAILNCSKILQENPTWTRPLLYQAVMKLSMNSFNYAEMDFEKALRVDADCALIYYNRAICRTRSGRFQEAIRDYSICLLLLPFNCTGKNNTSNQLRIRALINRALLILEHHHNTELAILDCQEAGHMIVNGSVNVPSTSSRKRLATLRILPKGTEPTFLDSLVSQWPELAHTMAICQHKCAQ